MGRSRFNGFAGQDILVIGCGAGIDSLEFARHGAKVTAIDFTENAVQLTKELAKEAGLPVEVVKVDAKKLKFADNSFLRDGLTVLRSAYITR